MKKRLLLLVGLFVFILASSFSAETIHYMESAANKARKNQYYLDMLKLALDKSVDKYGEFDLVGFGGNTVQSRVIEEVKRGGNIDVMWTMTSVEREQVLKAIRIPLFKGLLGHRIFIIRKGDEDRFAAVETFEDLQQLKAGQGHDWPDTKILKAGGIPVQTAPQYKHLFKMLSGKRFDYFPRGINEPWSEVERFEDGKLTVEKTIMVQYPAPIYFFVNKDNRKLAARIEYGLERAIADGSFNNLLFTHPNNKEIFELVNIPNRKIFRIDNPLLSEASTKVLKNNKYWYKLGEEKEYQ